VTLTGTQVVMEETKDPQLTTLLKMEASSFLITPTQVDPPT